MSYEKKGNNILKVLVEIVLCLMIAIVLVGVVQQFFLAPVAVAGVSMMPTINSEGDKVFVQKKFFKIERDCVVVFYRPNSEDVTSKNPANSISVSEFFNSLPFVNKIPNLTEESDVSDDYTCVIKRVIGIPGDKIEKLEEILKASEGGTVFVGDGINDAPSLSRADVGKDNFICYGLKLFSICKKVCIHFRVDSFK